MKKGGNEILPKYLYKNVKNTYCEKYYKNITAILQKYNKYY